MEVATFSPAILVKKMQTKNLSYKQIAALTKTIDKKGKGVSDMTCYRVLTGISDPTAKSISLLSCALGVSPKSTFIK